MSDILRKRLIADLLDYLSDDCKELLETELVTIGSIKVVIDDQATGEVLSALRKSKNVKTSELAKAMGISDVMLRKLESGARGWNLAKIKQYKDLVGKLAK